MPAVRETPRNASFIASGVTKKRQPQPQPPSSRCTQRFQPVRLPVLKRSCGAAGTASACCSGGASRSFQSSNRAAPRRPMKARRLRHRPRMLLRAHGAALNEPCTKASLDGFRRFAGRPLRQQPCAGELAAERDQGKPAGDGYGPAPSPQERPQAIAATAPRPGRDTFKRVPSCPPRPHISRSAGGRSTAHAGGHAERGTLSGSAVAAETEAAGFLANQAEKRRREGAGCGENKTSVADASPSNVCNTTRSAVLPNVRPGSTNTARPPTWCQPIFSTLRARRGDAAMLRYSASACRAVCAALRLSAASARRARTSAHSPANAPG